MTRCEFFIDGFNLYYSLRDAQRQSKGKVTKWFDIPKFCQTHCVNISHRVGNRTELVDIHFFTAYPNHKSLPARERYKLYIEYLEKSGVKIHYGSYRKRNALCNQCFGKTGFHTEKQTDVYIASHALSQLHLGTYDVAVFISGDTDLIPVLRSIREISPEKKTTVIFPFSKSNDELKDYCDFWFRSKLSHYQKHQIPTTMTFSDGLVISMPNEWSEQSYLENLDKNRPRRYTCTGFIRALSKEEFADKGSIQIEDKSLGSIVCVELLENEFFHALDAVKQKNQIEVEGTLNNR